MNGKSGQNKNVKNKLCIMNRQDLFFKKIRIKLFKTREGDK